ncbi:MAG TPA: PRC-barrel domain-containing protein [Humidesulfovibrio sp.]|uniref:PRC-barrel domain-containing protein n=1 Tax=Humidesulfovibrio sp. TaxID=2910988 RepID=UPI002CF75C00|nr:PRC-barrel domain-containing protein [Humidesulfovibrio sp.]HWR02768.1 PRC-barrel domain-containing protein [Humidesulfovibrio sp.]
MLTKAKMLTGYSLHCLDGEIGKVVEFYFDDQHWGIRYLVANTGNWLTGKQVLISPYALIAVDAVAGNIRVNLTKRQIEEGPPLDTDKPVSRQFEQDYYAYYGWPMYWSGRYMWGYSPFLARDPAQWREPVQGGEAWNPHLRSMNDVSGHTIQASDGEIGHVDDFIIDDETWAIRYFIIDTQNWWPGKHVLVAPQWIDKISWSESTVFVNLTRDSIMQSPEYTGQELVSRDYEIGLHHHYNRKGYWAK